MAPVVDRAWRQAPIAAYEEAPEPSFEQRLVPLKRAEASGTGIAGPVNDIALRHLRPCLQAAGGPCVRSIAT